MPQNKSSWNHWKLLTKNGRQVWAYKPSSQNIDDHLDNAQSFTEQDMRAFNDDFTFDRNINPTSADKVFRHQALVKNSYRYTGKRPKASSKKEQALIDSLIKGMHHFSQLQTEEGHWPGDYGGPLFLLPGLLIASYITKTPFPRPHREMMQVYLFNHQHTNGGWGMHIEGEPTMFGTVMQYVSLRLLGIQQQDPRLVKASAWIKENGGAATIPSWGKFYLAILNLYHWDGFNSLFPEMWLFPKWLPVHPSRYWCHSRMVYLPMAYCQAHQIQVPENDLILSLRKEIYNEDFDTINWPAQRDRVCAKDCYTKQSPVLKWMNLFTNGYEKIRPQWLRDKASDYLLKYINAEDAQTEYLDIGPVSKAINSICIWHAYGKDSEPFKKHVARWYDYLWVAEDGMKMSGYNGSQLWDVAFTTKAMLESDLGLSFPETLNKSYQFIDNMQILSEHATHQEFFRHPMIGSWPFSTAEQGWPVADCTAKGLSATLAVHKTGIVKTNISDERIKQAVDVILSYQNKDGGWPTYELSRAPKWLEALNPSEIFADIMIDYSWTECSAACVIALLEILEHYPDYKNNELQAAISRGLQFIVQQQKQDGSWYGGWAVCFTYATWFAVEALVQGKDFIDTEQRTQCINKACNFLISKQMPDGGWGETYESCAKMVYTQAASSQVVNTAWALLALQAADAPEKQAIQQGIDLLISRQLDNGDWAQENISGVFNYNCMITYSSYRNIFPIWALNRFYQHKRY
ncbi:MAG: lanosterol synthase [Methyloprofundus sp.]|nr:MAG: lanosterol synthase [Methyloprofundus sp.]